MLHQMRLSHGQAMLERLEEEKEEDLEEEEEDREVHDPTARSSNDP